MNSRILPPYIFPLTLIMLLLAPYGRSAAIVAGKDVGVFLFYFFHIQIFFWFNIRYVAKLLYFEIGKSSNSA